MVRARKGYFFVIDALVALALLVIIATAIYRPLPQKSRTLNAYLLADNFLEYLSKTKVRDLPLEQQETIEENISSIDLYLSEAIGELYWKSIHGCSDCLTLAKTFLEEVSTPIISPEYAYRVTIGDENNMDVLLLREPYGINDSSILATSKKIVFVMNGTQLVEAYILSIEVGIK